MSALQKHQVLFIRTLAPVYTDIFPPITPPPGAPPLSSLPCLLELLQAKLYCTTRLCLSVSQPFHFVQLSRPEVVKRNLSQTSLPPLLVATSARTTSHLSAAEIYVAVQKEANPARQCWVGLVLRWQLCVWYCSWLWDRLWPGVSEICHKWKLEKVRTVQSR